MQALEAARSITPDDPRLAGLDAHIETLRAELGTAQIQAAINAGNLERALQLLDTAERTKSLSGAKRANCENRYCGSRRKRARPMRRPSKHRARRCSTTSTPRGTHKRVRPRSPRIRSSWRRRGSRRARFSSPTATTPFTMSIRCAPPIPVRRPGADIESDSKRDPRAGARRTRFAGHRQSGVVARRRPRARQFGRHRHPL